MNKLALLIWGDAPCSMSDVARAVHTQVAPALRSAGATHLKLSMTEDLPPRLSILPLRRDPLALFSVWSERDVLSECAATLVSTGLRWAAYRVTEAMPVRYQRTWQDGERSPGAVLLTLFRKKPGVSQERFLQIWHGEHTPLSLRVHPLWSYTRNVVEAKLSEGAPDYDGIVEEHFRERSDILRPWRMFGGKARMLPNMVKIGLHVNTFLHLPSVENYLLREYHLLSDYR